MQNPLFLFRHPLLVLMTLVLGLAAASASAEVKTFGKHQVHYSIFPSTFLQPEIAREYNLQRSRSIGIINVSMFEEDEDGRIETIGGSIEGDVKNDIQQSRPLNFRRISEGDSVYYIAQFQYSHSELLTFEFEARPRGGDRALPVRVAHSLFDD